MKSFVDPYAMLFVKLIELLPKTESLKISYSLDSRPFFERKVAALVGQYPHSGMYAFDNGLYQNILWIEQHGFINSSSGTAFKEEEALFFSQCEFVERVSSWLPLDAARRLDFLPSAIQKEDKRTIKSAWGWHRKTVPLSELYWGLAKTHGSKRHVTTSGVAGHFKKDEALLHAWLELIERDGLLMYWLHTVSPKHILVSEESDEGKLIQSLQKKGMRIYLLDITSDLGIPVCLAVVLQDMHGKRFMGVGAAAGFGRQCIGKALREALVLAEKEAPGPRVLPEKFVPFNDARVDMRTRRSIALSDKGQEHMAFLFSSPETISVESFLGSTKDMSAQEQLAYLKTLFKDRAKQNVGYEVFMYEFTDSLTKTFGFYVIRVICSALYPLYLSEHFADPDHPRLKEFVQNMHLEGKSKLNTWPHPFS